jgi:hypothetical protein
MVSEIILGKVSALNAECVTMSTFSLIEERCFLCCGEGENWRIGWYKVYTGMIRY